MLLAMQVKRAILLHDNGCQLHDDAMKWKYFPYYRHFVHRSPVYSLHKGQVMRAFNDICVPQK